MTPDEHAGERSTKVEGHSKGSQQPYRLKVGEGGEGLVQSLLGGEVLLRDLHLAADGVCHLLQQAICQAVDEGVHSDGLATVPGGLDGGAGAHVVQLAHHIQLAQPAHVIPLASEGQTDLRYWGGTHLVSRAYSSPMGFAGISRTQPPFPCGHVLQWYLEIHMDLDMGGVCNTEHIWKHTFIVRTGTVAQGHNLDDFRWM